MVFQLLSLFRARAPSSSPPSLRIPRWLRCYFSFLRGWGLGFRSLSLFSPALLSWVVCRALAQADTRIPKQDLHGRKESVTMIVKDVSVAALTALVEVRYLEPTGSTTFTSPRSSPLPSVLFARYVSQPLRAGHRLHHDLQHCADVHVSATPLQPVFSFSPTPISMASLAA